MPFVGDMQITLPFFISVAISFFAFVGTINAVNLTDGLDGLAGKQIALVLAFIFVITYLFDFNTTINLTNIKYLCLAFFGALLGFLVFNSNPASIFMGDSGSMGFGALIASIFILLKIELLLPIICLIFFLEALSVILQVIVFKATKGKKRLFKMSPFHHHLQLSGMKDQKITDVAFTLTFIIIIIFLGSFL